MGRATAPEPQQQQVHHAPIDAKDGADLMARQSFSDTSFLVNPQARVSNYGEQSGVCHVALPTATEVLILEHESDDVPTKAHEYMMQIVGLQQIVAMESSGFV